MNRRGIVLALALTLGLLAPGTGDAQSFGDVALVATESPVFLLPDATRTPLRTLPVGVSLTILQRQGEWLQVTFEDAQLGRRTAWIEAKAVRIRPASTQPAQEPPDPPATPGAPAGTAPPRPPAAQSRRAPTRRPVVQPIGVRLFGGAALDWMAASKSFDAVTGSDRVTSYGGGVQVTNLWRGLFVEAAAHRATADGERVFVFGDEVFPLGIPVEITMTPVDAVVGWRTPVGRVVPYLGAGMTFFKYQETADFADDDEDVDEWYKGVVVMGGVEVGVARWIHIRADVRYRQVNDALGLGGVSEFFDEDKLGGFGAGLQLVIGR